MDLDQDVGALTQSLWKIKFLDSTVASACAANVLSLASPEVTFAEAARDEVLTYQIQTAAEIAQDGLGEFIVPALKVTQSVPQSCEMAIEAQYCDNNRFEEVLVDADTVWDTEGSEPCIWQAVPLSDTTYFVNDQANGEVYVSFTVTQEDFMDDLLSNFGPMDVTYYPEVYIRVRFVYYDVTKATDPEAKTYDYLTLVIKESGETTTSNCESEYSAITYAGS
jgi:hypothetical protein